MRYLVYLLMSMSLASCSNISSTSVLNNVLASKGNTRPFDTPLPVNTAHKKLALGHTSAVGIKQDGSVWTWGKNGSGQLGYKTEKDYSDTPKQVVGLNNIISVATGRNYSLVLDKKGVVYLSGSSRQWNMNIDETKTKQFTLSFIPILKHEKAIKVIARGGYALLMQADGRVIYCCDGRVKEFPENVVDVALTLGETYFLLSNGQVLAEDQDNGEYLKQRDIKTVDSNTKTVKAKNIGRVKAITTNFASAFALDEKGRVWEWSYYLHRVDKSNVEPLPILINKFSNAVSLTAGIANAALLDNGEVYFWGFDTGRVRGTGEAIPHQKVTLKNVYVPEKSLWTWK